MLICIYWLTTYIIKQSLIMNQLKYSLGYLLEGMVKLKKKQKLF